MMDYLLKTIIAIDNDDMRKQVVRVMQRIPAFDIVCVVKEGEEAYRRIRKLNPDIVFIEAMMPGMDCVTLIESVMKVMKDEAPSFFVGYYFFPEVLSMIAESDIVLQCHAFPLQDVVLGRQLERAADYYKSKKYVVMNRRGDSLLKENEGYYGEKSNLRDPDRVRRIVSHEMSVMGANVKYKGYKYIETALNYEMRNEEHLQNGVMGLYKTISERMGCKSTSTEKALRVAIKNTWESGNQDYFKCLWGYSEIGAWNCPNNSEFLRVVINSLEKEYMW